MRHFIAAIVVMTISVPSVCQIHKENVGRDKSVSQQNAAKRCPANPDSLYDRQQVLEQLAAILNDSVPEFRRSGTPGYYVEDERGVGFFIYDLTDPSNKDTSVNDCINFINNHIYHFAPIRRLYSLSHILILEDGKLKIFKSINCKDRGDSLEDVITYLDQKLNDRNDKDVVINRVKYYRRYGIYLTIDDSSIICKEIGSDKK